MKNNGNCVREGKPPLSGREGACRRRKQGEDCLSEASSAAPDGGSSDRANKPDNSGGASWFVLLAAEKNEQQPLRGEGLKGINKTLCIRAFKPLRHCVPPPLYFALQNTEEEFKTQPADCATSPILAIAEHKFNPIAYCTPPTFPYGGTQRESLNSLL